METKPAQRANAFTLVEVLIVVTILGLLAAIVAPQFTEATDEAMATTVQGQLQTVRRQIELYNAQNPTTPYDEFTPVATFWNPLVAGDYVHGEPRNPLQNGSVVVGAAPAPGTGWVWAMLGGDPWTLNLYAVDESGAFFTNPQTGEPW